MTGLRRTVLWSTVVLCTAVCVGLAVVAVVVNLDTADRAASVVGAVAALAGMMLATYQALTPGNPDGVRADGMRAIAAGGSITGNAVGTRSRAAGAPAHPGSAAGASGRRVEAIGDGALAAGQDVTGNAIGDESELG